MTIYTGEASTKQKLKGIVDGMIAAITQRLHAGKSISDEDGLKKKLKAHIETIYDNAEEGKAHPKDMPLHVAAISLTIAEHVPATDVAEPKMITQVVRNLAQEADTIGKGK